MRISIYSKSGDSLRGRKTIMAPVDFRTESSQLGITISATEIYELDNVKKGRTPMLGHRDLTLSMTWADVSRFVEAIEEMILKRDTAAGAADGGLIETMESFSSSQEQEMSDPSFQEGEVPLLVS